MPGIRTIIHPDIHNTIMRNSFQWGVSQNLYKIVPPNCLILSRPLAADPSLLGEGLEDTYASVLQKLEEQGLNPDDYYIIANVVGNGATERHMATLYKPRGINRLCLFDSKTSDVDKFISPLSDSKVRRIWDGFAGMFRALLPGYSKVSAITHSAGGLNSLEYKSLGVQSYLDPITCGYYSLQVSRSIQQLIAERRPVTVYSLLERLDAGRPVHSALASATTVDKTIDPSYWGFIKKAWHDTFIKPAIETGKSQHDYGFRHYFAGYPQGSRVKRGIYYATLSFLILPLIHSIKIPTEFVAKVLAETASYLKNRLLFWTPTWTATQYLRSGLLLAANGLHFVLEGFRIALRVLISPINSFEAGYKKHWFLGALSAVLSTAFYSALIVSTLPLIPAVAVLGGLAVIGGSKSILDWIENEYFSANVQEGSMFLDVDFEDDELSKDLFNSECHSDPFAALSSPDTPRTKRSLPVPEEDSFRLAPGSASMAANHSMLTSSTPVIDPLSSPTWSK